jgi:hypothetical protein
MLLPMALDTMGSYSNNKKKVINNINLFKLGAIVLNVLIRKRTIDK